ncbi:MULTISPECIES: hypothetical protein [Rodentibacter]|uniref:Lytic murein transglycosylase n=2 Tax=Rodentibacter TaxID=1960084 RepID=A0A1V3JM93_9PAST|nr:MULTISPECIES: hypothetical protein [Rodentibacter]OOF38277.1 hypothetical protein BKK47_09765 [Rodentibacter mrazii]OOF57497.1 hypothetical protein BKK55_04355 [Rodentibacter genomosp. 2]
MAVSRLLVSILLPFLCSTTAQAFNGFGKDVEQYIQEAAKRYQVSEVMLRGLVKMEDGWYGKVSPTGPIGVGQFTRDTWNWLAQTERGKQLGMRLITPSIQGTRGDPRYHKRTNTFATALLARWHIEQFQQRGISITDENLYMAHNIGLDGFHRAILGRSTAEDIQNMRRNGMKRGMSVKQFIAYQKGRYNSHKSIANFMPVTQKQTEMVWVKPRYEQKAKIGTMSSHQSAVNNSSIIWIEPSDAQMTWVNPTKM